MKLARPKHSSRKLQQEAHTTRGRLKAGAKWGAILALALACPFELQANEASSSEVVSASLFPDAPSQMGLPTGMPLFPSAPVPGHPGANPARERRVWDKPQLVNYPGSVEHFRVSKQQYMLPVNPYNHRSLIKNFIAVDLPGIPKNLIETFAEPVHYVTKGGGPGYIRTEDKRPPVPVVRLKPGGQRLSFKLDPQAIGLYVVRLIGALETKSTADLEMPKDLILEMTVNDGPKGEVNRYILRQRGTDNFYSLGEFFFNVVDNRPLEISVASHSDSKVDLLVHNVDVHDELAECAKRAGKAKSVDFSDDFFVGNWKVDPSVLLEPARKGDWEGWFQALKDVRDKRLQASENEGLNVKQLITAAVERGDTKVPQFVRMMDGIESRLAKLREELPEKSDSELYGIWRKQRDTAIWNSLPPINRNFIGLGNSLWRPDSGVDPDTKASLEANGLVLSNLRRNVYEKDLVPGAWRMDKNSVAWQLMRTLPDGKEEFYTVEDLAQHKPLPGMPFPDVPWGTRFEKDGKGYLYHPITEAVGNSFGSAVISLGKLPVSFLENADLEAARDQALLLCRTVYDLPTYNSGHAMLNVAVPNGAYYLPPAHHHRQRLYQVYESEHFAATYDALFPFIKDNQSLADAVGEFIPWVKTPQDVVKMIDTRLLQWSARQIAYFQAYYNHELSAKTAKLAAYQGDPSITTPWVWLIFNWTWEYPEEYAGIEDYLYLSTQRDGTSSIGSFFYALNGDTASRAIPFLKKYIEQGGDKKYDLNNPKLYPRLFLAPYFPLEARVAGMYAPAVGDIGGPNSGYGHWMDNIEGTSTRGWESTKDPLFAYLLAHYGKLTTISEKEKAEIQAAADSVPRNPFMAQRSRVLSDWGGILEGGTQSDDFRFRHALRIRVGSGSGHAHSDGLDLGLWSLGLPMSGDAGARGEYGRPSCFSSLIHNVATVGTSNWAGNSWVSNLVDIDGSQYLRAQGERSPKNMMRQVSLIEVDQGKPAKNPPSTKALGPETTYDNNVVLPRAYAVDFSRTHGGDTTLFNFHGPTDDEFTANVQPGQITDKDREILKGYVVEGRQWAGTIGEENLVATWRMAREPQEFVEPERGKRVTPASEKHILGAAYDPESPRKYLRVHVLGQKDQRFLTGLWISAPPREVGDAYRQAHIVRNGKSSLFAAVWEPYAGTPFIKSVKLDGDPANADSPATVHVETVDGIRDTIYASANGTEAGKIAGEGRVVAQYAYISKDTEGLRQVSLVEGEELETSLIDIRPDAPRWEAQITEIDHMERTARLDRAIPAKLLDGAFYEVGRPANEEPKVQGRWTSFEALKITPAKNHSILHWRKGADMFTAKIVEVEKSTDGSATLTLDRNIGYCPFVTNVAREKVWNSTPFKKTLTVTGPEIGDNDFKVGERVYGYEVGPGDTWRVATKVSLKRESKGLYQLSANVGCELRMAGKAAWSQDRKNWKPVRRGKGKKNSILKVSDAQLQAGPVYIQWAGTGK